MKMKKMSLSEFSSYLRKNMKPIKVDKDNLPSWAKGIPEKKLHSVFASGSLSSTEDSANVEGQIGGMDIFRHAEPKDGVNLNKDHYYIVRDPDDDENLFVLGPYKEDPNSPSDEHHLDDLPERLRSLKLSAP